MQVSRYIRPSLLSIRKSLQILLIPLSSGRSCSLSTHTMFFFTRHNQPILMGAHMLAPAAMPLYIAWLRKAWETATAFDSCKLASWKPSIPSIFRARQASLGHRPYPRGMHNVSSQQWAWEQSCPHQRLHYQIRGRGHQAGHDRGYSLSGSKGVGSNQPIICRSMSGHGMASRESSLPTASPVWSFAARGNANDHTTFTTNYPASLLTRAAATRPLYAHQLTVATPLWIHL
jgi:hypothetical protein